MSCSLINSTCEIAASCGANYNFINYNYLYSCQLNNSESGLIAIIVLIVPILFFILGLVSDNILSESISKITEQLKIPHNIAAMTLIAFANGTPDLATSLLAGNGSDEGPFISLGQLCGAFIFSSTFSLSIIILRSKYLIQFNKIHIIKELFSYVIIIFIICIYGIVGYINIYMSICFILAYLLYVIISLYLNTKYSTPDDDLNRTLSLEDLSDDEDKTLINQNKKKTEINDEKSILKKIIDMISMPLNFMFNLTIPHDDNNFIKLKVIRFIIVTISLFFSLFIFAVHPKLLIIFVIALSFAFVDLITFINDKEFNFYFKEFITVFASLAWVYLAAGCLSDTLTLISKNYGLSPVFLATMVLAIGNTLGDLFSNSALAKIGKGTMVGYATYSCQIFNLFIGFGSNVLKYNIKNKKVFDFNIFNLKEEKHNSYFMYLIFIFCFISIFSTLFELLVTGFKLKKKYSGLLFILYGGYIAIVCVYEFYISKKIN